MKLMEALKQMEAKYPKGPQQANNAIALKIAFESPLEEAERVFFDWANSTIGDIHKHRCPSCRTIWEHETPPPSATDADYKKAHLCPRGCGIDVRDKFFPEEEVEIIVKS